MLRGTKLVGSAGIVAIVFATPAAVAQSSTDQFEYDALGRLVRVQTGQGALTKYSYDKATNRSQVQAQRQLDQYWLATELPHGGGYAEPWGGWAANVTHPTMHMTYGPYTPSVPAGPRTAVWRMMIDVNVAAEDDDVLVLDVYDVTANEVLATRVLRRSEFAAPMSYQIFEIPFHFDASRAGHLMEFRTFFLKRAYTNVERIGYY